MRLTVWQQPLERLLRLHIECAAAERINNSKLSGPQIVGALLMRSEGLRLILECGEEGFDMSAANTADNEGF